MATSGALSGAVSGASAGAAFGPWGAAIGGGIGLLSGGKDGGSDQTGQSMSQQELMQMQDRAFRQQIYQNEVALNQPQRQRLQAMALSDQPLYYGERAAQINRQYDQANRNINYLNYGTNLNFGQGASQLQANALQRRQALSGAYQQGLQQRNNLLMQSAQLGAPASQISAAQGVGQSYQNASNMYGNWANMYNQAAQQQAMNTANAAGGLGQLGGYFAAMNRPTPNVNMTPPDHGNTDYNYISLGGNKTNPWYMPAEG